MKPKSDCCNAEMTVSTGKEGTSCYICLACSQPCDEVERESTKTRSTDKSDLISAFIRDVTKVHPMSKSNTRRRLDEILDKKDKAFKECVKEVVGEGKSVKDLFPNIDTKIPTKKLAECVLKKDGYNQKRQEIINILKKWGFYEE